MLRLNNFYFFNKIPPRFKTLEVLVMWSCGESKICNYLPVYQFIELLFYMQVKQIYSPKMLILFVKK